MMRTFLLIVTLFLGCTISKAQSLTSPLRSGWAWGQEYLQDGVAAFAAAVGKGKLYAFGPEITFRSQTYGTFNFLFNQFYSHKK